MVDLGMSKYYVVDERALLHCGLNMTSREDWSRMSWTTVWTTWLALGFICVYSLTKTVYFMWRRSFIKSTESQGASSSIIARAGSAASTPARVTEEDLAQVLEFLSQDDNGIDGQWEDVVDKQSDSVAYTAKRRDPKDGGATEYLSTTVHENCSTQLARDFYMDSDFRAGWDKTLVQHRQLEVCPTTGTEVGSMVKKYPLMTAREYVLAWRLWEGEDQTYYCVLKVCEHEDAPRQSKYKRVDVYNSGWRIRKVPGRESACELKMYHQEDGGVGREMAKVAFRRGIWNYVVKMDTQLRRYALKHAQLKIDPASAVALARKMPDGLQAKYGSISTQEITTGEGSEREGGGKQLTRLSSQKKLARSLLLVGGAVFLSQGSVSLGAKIATACIVNRAMRPDGSSSFLRRVLDRSRVHRVRRDVL
ncbi:hypothetical protein KC19_3G259900 [Ceratodon purpureus]|uniref:START domain-containing protein n=1 Tax=Ceratodon purpureus TaxID=3225 RepID=A0A8T0IR68_CERPU|nr:hypothetical protein KC19_3G259900 [Ceratodon purpureus]